MLVNCVCDVDDDYQNWLFTEHCQMFVTVRLLELTLNFAILHRLSWSPLQKCKYYRATLRSFKRATVWHRCYWVSL